MRTDVVFFLVLLCWLPFSQLCSAGDTLKAGENITQNSGNLVSTEGNFELGFFRLPDETSVKKYLGIWYHGMGNQTVVWVANRDKPVEVSSGVFQIAKDGNLVVTDESESQYWSSQVKGKTSSTNRIVKLLDSGNLVLMDVSGTRYLWQSFENPTDTFLPGMKMDEKLTLTSWVNESDPGSGSFTFTRTGGSANLVVKNESQLYWILDIVQDSREMTPVILNLLFNDTSNISLYSFRNKRIHLKSSYDYEKSRLVMVSYGEIQFLKWENNQWKMVWYGPAEKCDIYNHCGNFSSCNKNNWQFCKCLPGFVQIDNQHHGESRFQRCVRKSTSCNNTQDMVFLDLTNIKVGNSDQSSHAESEAECQSICQNMCTKSHTQCQAYSYNKSTYSDRNPSVCRIWTRDLPTLQEEYDGGSDISILVSNSDIAPTAKSCEPCGTNIIPYPLSTEPNCGDPMYGKFTCDYSTGKVSFKIPGVKNYPVIWIDSRKFVIQTDASYDCDVSTLNDQDNFPFNVTECVKGDEVEIHWLPAPEPPCHKPIDCVNWPHSTCRPTSKGETRCLCDSNFKWNNSIIVCTKEESSGKLSINRLALILAAILVGMVILACTIVFARMRRKKITHNLDGASHQIHQSLHDSERHVKGLIGLGSLEEKNIEGIEVPCYSFASIVAATDNFSDSNKLGRGGYGPVYKGRFPGGQDIAVKRLSSVSTQGLEEFKNEVVLIAKLQHRNLVRLRGYCIKGDEKILLYEFMPNKSLDLFIFDRTRTLLLDWPMRFDIIVGIARGLLYLHQDSRLRVIHRDLKTSNILLDEEMNPKISDFGLAKIFGGKETEASTERVVGTYGYMAPEYALDGFFSIKSDVFSFGVVLLEILSGKKNTGFYPSKQISSLLGYAWKLWTETKLLDLKDLPLGETCNENQFTKCALIGLLCVQDEPADRPTMSNVLTMLDSEISTIPIPTQPTFFVNKHLSSSASSSSKPETSLQFESTLQEGR